MKYYLTYFGQTGQAYSEGAYGEGTYSCTTQQQADGICNIATGGTSGSGASGGGLTNTGIAVAVIVTLACLIIFVSLVVRIWRRKPVLQEIEIPQEEQEYGSQRH